MAAMGGFDKPILHGLCFYGFTARSVLDFFKINPKEMEHYSARFVGHVFPGETLVVQAWKEGNTLIFASATKERGKPVLVGYMKIKDSAKL